MPEDAVSNQVKTKAQTTLRRKSKNGFYNPERLQERDEAQLFEVSAPHPPLVYTQTALLHPSSAFLSL